MASISPKKFGRLAWKVARHTGRGLNPAQFWASLTLNSPVELTLVPQDLRTIDPVLAQEFYYGIYSLGNSRVDTKGNSPFQLPPNWENVTAEWQSKLHCFRWIRHLETNKNAISNTQAQSLVGDWIDEWGKPGDVLAWRPDIAANRLIAWLCHSVLIIDQAEYGLYNNFLNCIGVHIRHLNDHLPDTPDGLPRLQVRLALVYAALCVGLQRIPNTNTMDKIHDALGDVLAEQFFADGGHVSRCPSVLPEILIDLLPLRQAYDRVGIAPSQNFLSAIDRMMPAIRYYRHRDGKFARFNGVGASQQELIATVLRYDDAIGEPVQEASQSGYQRLSGGSTTIIMDVGRPPDVEFSNKAHAGCLSFEMSSLRSCFITNCGAPEPNNQQQVDASRSTAAHSTAILHDTSSGRFHRGGVFSRQSRNSSLSGPLRVLHERKQMNGFTQVAARHDGYLRKFGVWHERILQLSDDGSQLFGRDRFFTEAGKSPVRMRIDDCAVRFHLHPSILARVDENSGEILINSSENHVWKFTCDAERVGLEESVYFASAGRPQPTSQIVIGVNLSKTAMINWHFEQTIGTRLQ